MQLIESTDKERKNSHSRLLLLVLLVVPILIRRPVCLLWPLTFPLSTYRRESQLPLSEQWQRVEHQARPDRHVPLAVREPSALYEGPIKPRPDRRRRRGRVVETHSI
jgi:hypothetical protein